MKNLLLSMLLLFGLACSGHNASMVPMDNPTGVILAASHPLGPFCTIQRWTPRVSDVRAAEKILAAEAEAFYPESSLGREYRGGHWPNHIRQCVGMINDRGHRLVWINYLCKKSRDGLDGTWKDDIITANGGGECFFNGTANLDTARCENFSINSP
jgi:hypothetical protein